MELTAASQPSTVPQLFPGFKCVAVVLAVLFLIPLG